MDNKKNILNKDSFKQAGENLLQKIHDAEKQESHDILSSWENIESHIYKKTLRTKRIRLIFSSVAASVAILLGLGLYFNKMSEDESLLTLTLLEDRVFTQEADEITIIEKNSRIQLKDGSSIQYDSIGRSNLEEQSITRETTQERQENKTRKDKKEELNQIIVPKGRRVNITFSDGTKIYVNAGTRVIYPAFFAKNKREILVEGEVYLEVKEDPSRPFIVKTTGFDVKVLGTQFNVCAYKDNVATVVLVGGKVEVETVKNEKLILSPNQLLEISNDGTNLKEVDVFKYVCWKDNMIVLDDKPLRVILEQLSRYYGRPILYKEDVANITLSGKLELKERIEDVITNICESTYLQFETDENNNLLITK